MIKSSTSIIVFGASGRMGSRICAIASSDPTVRLSGAVVREGSAREGQIVREVADGTIRFISPQKAREIADFRGGVVIDFSSSEGAAESLALALHHGAAIVVGTTAMSPTSIEALREGAKKIPVLISPNTSMGVAVLAAAVSLAAKLLGGEFECSIVEAHHSKKKDAPSGTALRLARAVEAGGGVVREDQVLAMRGGDVIGEHTVRFAGAGEYIELTHRATSRDLFAQGALRAARWIADQSPGMYTMEDVLGVAAGSRQNRA